MALNPDKVADVLQVYLNDTIPGRWDNLVTPRQIETKAMRRGMSPNSLANWLGVQVSDLLKSRNVDQLEWETTLSNLLRPADLLAITQLEIAQASQHNILFIESKSDHADGTQKNMVRIANTTYGIPKENINFTYRDSVPTNKALLLEAMSQHTASFLHNLNIVDLLTIQGYVRSNPQIAQRLVLVKTNSLSPEMISAYEKLEELGVTVVGPKANVDTDEIVRVLFGLV